MRRLVLGLMLVAGCSAVPVNNANPTGPTGPSNNTSSKPIEGGDCTGEVEGECVTGEVCNPEPDTLKCVPICASDDDCEGSLSCGPDSYCTGLGASCSDASACESDEVCKDNHCQKPARCTTKDDCPLNYSCFQNACLANTTGSCRIDTDCNKSAQCTNGGCKCVNNKCQVNVGAACTPDDAYSVCSTTQYCNSGACTAATPCADQTACLGGLVCVDGFCKTPKKCNGTQCDAGFSCSNGFCLSDQTGKDCDSDTDCGPGFYCKGGGISIPGQPTGGACAAGCKNDQECPTAGQHCDMVSHQCVAQGGGGTTTHCVYDVDCDPGCANGNSTAVRCDGLAGSDKVCDIGLLDQSAGNPVGVCRDRCIKSFGIELVGCPNSATCVSSTFTGNSTDPAVYCGGGSGGYSACY